MSVFRKVYYPYRPDIDPVDATLNLSIEGGWTSSSAANFAKGFVIGLSLFTLSPVLGPSMSGLHTVSTGLRKDGQIVVSYSGQVETDISWGMLADTNAVAHKAEELQVRKICLEVSQWLRANRAKILRELGMREGE